ncbi:SDR family oxidoreductase [Sediminibacillus massiliensis]|uniref:SDR family oxidoreductase n=1 Tax=Sediminibacillus massiliensis TaxID=1926277 RepID=UPI00098852E2|nr:SDR family oxidoreductase [Sediminibacillus massiliensis]
MTSRKTAVITGVSHANGIGAAVCRTLAEKGMNIFFTHWESEPEWGVSFQKEIIEKGVDCSHLEIDLSKSEAHEYVLNAAQADFDTPSVLVNNAAYSVNDGYMALDSQIIDQHYAVNMRATLMLSVEFARRFEKAEAKNGRIINMTSGQGQGPMIGELAYGATKGAISAFTLSLSAEVAPLGITVNAVNPGPTDTGWMTGGIKESLQPKFLMGRIGQPEDAANLVGFLASEEAGWITGQVINSEGAFLRQ